MRLPTVSHAELPIPIHNINVNSHRVHILRWIVVVVIRLLRWWNIFVVPPPSNNDIGSRSGCVVNQFVEITCDDVLPRAPAFDIPSMTSVRRSSKQKSGSGKSEAYQKSLEKSEWWKKDEKIRPRLCFLLCSFVDDIEASSNENTSENKSQEWRRLLLTIAFVTRTLNVCFSLNINSRTLTRAWFPIQKNGD